MDNTDLILAFFGTRREELPVAVFDNNDNFIGVQSADEYNGIIDGEFEVVSTESSPILPTSQTLPYCRMLPGETYPQYLQRKWVG